MTQQKKLPGINSVISAATIRSQLEGVDVLGIRDGFDWIMQGDIEHVTPLTIEAVSRIHFRGGSHIGISRANPTSSPDHLENVVTSLLRLNVRITLTVGRGCYVPPFFPAIDLDPLLLLSAKLRAFHVRELDVVRIEVRRRNRVAAKSKKPSARLDLTSVQECPASKRLDHGVHETLSAGSSLCPGSAPKARQKGKSQKQRSIDVMRCH